MVARPNADPDRVEDLGNVMGVDAFAIGFSGVALVAYMSSLTSLGYTATQYALLSSALNMTGKSLKGFSGSVIDHLQANGGLMHAYAQFYIGAAALGAPAILLCFILARHIERLRRDSDSTSAA